MMNDISRFMCHYIRIKKLIVNLFGYSRIITLRNYTYNPFSSKSKMEADKFGSLHIIMHRFGWLILL